MFKIDWKEERNLTLLTDFYEITMANSFFKNKLENKIAYFDLYFRRIPDNGGFCIFAGLQQVIEYLNNLHFSESDIKYLKSKNLFDNDFLLYLKNFKFKCDVWSVHEGTPVFPGEPLITVRGPIIQAQLIETMLLLTINHQTLIATKANRVVRASKGRKVMEFGSRRAQGYDGAIFGARAAYIGGCFSTSCTITEKLFGIPTSGTMSHSWVQLFDSELEAFKAWTNVYPHESLFLVDTYNVLKSGIPNAIKVFNEHLVPKGIRPKGIRIDSGDIKYLTEKSRQMLDDAGFPDCPIIVSNSLDEYIIRDVLNQGAKIDGFGVGERLITSKSEPVLGGVYKLVAIENDNKIIPKIKISENTEKITTPGFKQVHRLFDKSTNKAIADLITFNNEIITENFIEIFDPIYTWKKKKIENFYAKKLLNPIFKSGECIYKSPSTSDIRDYCADEINTLWDEVLRFENPHKYYVDLSENMWNMKNDLLKNLTQEY